MGLVEGRAHRPGLNVDRLGDLPVIELRVVAEEEHETLTLGECRDQRPQLVVSRLAVRDGDLVEHNSWRRLFTAGAPRGVHDDPPDPGLEVTLAPEAGAAADRARERILDDVVGELRIADDRFGNAEKPVVAALVQQGERADRRPNGSRLALHTFYDQAET
jgi:hypothetical protein